MYLNYLFMPTVQTFAVREADVLRHNGGTRGSPIMPRDASLSDSKCWNGGQKLVAKTQRWTKMGYSGSYFPCNKLVLHMPSFSFCCFKTSAALSVPAFTADMKLALPPPFSSSYIAAMVVPPGEHTSSFSCPGACPFSAPSSPPRELSAPLSFALAP